MTDKRIKMDCPFCGESMTNIQLSVYGKEVVVIKCPNPSCRAELHGKSKQDVIDRWNRRI